MSNSMQMLRRLSLSLAVTSGLTMASAALAATDSDAAAAVQAPIEENQELGEILVRGQSLARMIEDAEDKFVRRFNKLNKDRDFDVVCDYLRLDRNSLATTRTCVPHFVGYVYVGGVVDRGILPAGGSICSPGNFITTDTGTYYSSGSCTPALNSYSGYSSYNGNSWDISYTSYSGYVAPAGISTVTSRPANPEAEKLRREYVRTLMRTIYSDQQLLEEATTLAKLRGEMQTIQDEYQMVKAEEDARKEAARRERREQRGTNSTAPRSGNPRF